MRTRIITCDINTTLRNVEDLLYRNNIGHLPVMEKGRMAGFLTRTDLIRAAGGSRKRDPAP
jgi:tRNA nucleotidyltransferase (CCA-adding enzyme)